MVSVFQNDKVQQRESRRWQESENWMAYSRGE